MQNMENFDAISGQSDLEGIKTALITKVLREKTNNLKTDLRFDSDDIVKNYAIANLLHQEKARLEDSESEDDMPLAVRLNRGKWKTVREVTIPQINRSKLNKFITKMKGKHLFDQMQKNLQKCKCANCLNSQKKTRHWNSPIVILKAIHHSLYTKKWNNVTKLLLMLIPHGQRYRTYISEVCETIEYTNPLILQNPDLKKQFGILNQLYRRKDQ